MKSRIYSSRAETVPLLGVPGGSLFTFTLRGVLASPGWSWVGDCSLSWGEGEWSWGDGDCNCGRDWGWDRGDWSWGTGDWSVAGGWGPGDWSWGPPPGFGVSSLPCLAPAGPLKPGSIWERGSISTDTLEIYRQETNEKEMQIKGVKNKVLKDNWGKKGEVGVGKTSKTTAGSWTHSGDKVQENKHATRFTTAVLQLATQDQSSEENFEAWLRKILFNAVSRKHDWK